MPQELATAGIYGIVVAVVVALIIIAARMFRRHSEPPPGSPINPQPTGRPR